jgi:hypothetical protein
MSTFNDLFEELLEKKVVVLALNAAESETTRVSLIRKWNQYKNRMNALGFLSDELANLSLSREFFEKDGIVHTRFLLRPRVSRRNYQIVSPVADSPVADGTNKSEDDSGK